MKKCHSLGPYTRTNQENMVVLGGGHFLMSELPLQEFKKDHAAHVAVQCAVFSDWGLGFRVQCSVP